MGEQHRSSRRDNTGPRRILKFQKALYMNRQFFIQYDQPDELVIHLCRVIDAIRDAMDTSQRRGQSNVTLELGTRLQQFADLIDRLPPDD